MRASVGGGSGPPSLVPRDLTAELCLIALASLGLLLMLVRLTACLSLFVRIYATRFAWNFAVWNTPYGVLYWSLLGGVPVLCLLLLCLV